MKQRLRRRLGLTSLLIGLVIFTHRGFAQETAWIDLDVSQVRLVSVTTATGDAQTVQLGLQIKMKPGFKTYWRSPGDAGIPPSFDWSGSHNLTAARVSWPAPERFVLGGLSTFGYADEVVLPIEVALSAPGQPLNANLRLVYGVCKDICVLGEAELALTVPSGIGSKTPHHDLVAWFDRLVPATGALGIDIVYAGMAPSGRTIEIVAKVAEGPRFEEPDILIEGLDEIALPSPKVDIDSDGRRVVVRYQLTNWQSVPDLIGRRVTLTLLDASYAIEKSVVL
ncbi:MAG: protein-disulfide reductase DsbD family protein [Proteobacteria bacterium]|nr:protein-disulfide reductase DsbD family protein [Pseudomonadota bacterium]